LRTRIASQIRAACGGDRGAPLPKLLEMARRNATLSVGATVAGRLERWTPHLTQLERISRAVEVDGRLHAWEWLVRTGTHDQALLKTDALDHHAAQVAPDLAGGLRGAPAAQARGPIRLLAGLQRGRRSPKAASSGAVRFGATAQFRRLIG
jgi:hypothetical protein